jgi:hypothetical protein
MSLLRVSKLMVTGLYKIRGAWSSVKQPAFSVGLEAAKPTNNLFFSNLTEPRAN